MGKMTKTQIINFSIKTAIKGVVAVGVGAIGKNALDNIPKSKNVLLNASMVIGAVVLGNLLVDKSTAYIDENLDVAFEQIEIVKSEIQKINSEEEGVEA